MIDGPSSVERYELLGELATGGMATVYFGRQRGAFGFSRTVAIKSMHPQLAKDPNFRSMFIDEANLTARIRHPNVVPTLDIVESPTKLLIVMEYVEGVSLSVLLSAARKRGQQLPVGVVAAIGQDVLQGLHAAHELTDENGDPLSVVHRDVSPQNILVGVDGIARVVDFGVAKATGRSYQTQTGEIRGKVGYMAPEQMFGEAVDRRVDLYSAGVVLWEALAGDRLFNAPTDAALVLLVTRGLVSPPSVARGERLPEGLDRLVERALSYDCTNRPATATEMAKDLAALPITLAPREEIGRLVRDLAPKEIALRASFLRQSSPQLPTASLDPEATAVLDVLTRATMTRELPVATTPDRPAFKRETPLLLGVALTILVALGTGATVFGIVRQRRAATHVPDVVSSAPAPTAAASSAPLLADPAPLPPPEAAPGPSASVDGPASSIGRRHIRRGPKGAVTAAASAPTRPDCTLPYVTDAEGHRHYKAECLK